MTPPDTIPTETLLEEATWLRRLARQLLRDESRADDVVQDTLVAAWKQRRDGRVPGRRWLGSVLRNLVRIEARSGARRTARESQTARAEAPDGPGPGDVVQRIDVHRQLVEAVLALAEPYRTTIALRFLEGHPPREVARRMGVPVKTVHTRIERALDRLRHSLDARHGGRRDGWALALGELASPLGLLGTAEMGAIAMGAAWKWSALTAGAVLLGVVVHSVSEPTPTPEEPVSPALATHESPEPSIDVPAADAAPRTEARREIAAPTEPAPEPPPEAPPTFAGLVADASGRPMADVDVRFVAFGETEPGEDVATSDPHGSFEFPYQNAGGRLVAAGVGVATLISPGVSDYPPVEPPVVVVAPAREYAGRVVDESRQALDGARLEVHLPADLAAQLLPGAFRKTVPIARATTGASGEFALPPLGYVNGLTLRISRPGYRAMVLPLPAASARDLELVLERGLEPGALAGFVVDGMGAAIEGAFVSTGALSTRTDETGAFLLPAAAVEGSEVRAIAAGRLPASEPLEGLGESERHSLMLVLADEALSIRGRVIDAEGAPVPEALVWTFDTEPFGEVVESLEGLDFVMGVETEAALDGRAPGRGCFAETAADGTFELSGLRRANYTLWARGSSSLAYAEVVDSVAGAVDVELRLEAAVTSPVRGRVVSLSGAPIEGVTVSAHRMSTQRNLRRGPPRSSAVMHTDAEGRFAFEEIAVEGTTLSVDAPNMNGSTQIDLADEPDLLDIEVPLPRASHVRLSLISDPKLANAVEIRDGNDETLVISAMVGTMRISSGGMPIEDGTTGILTTTEAARFAVLLLDGREVHREPLDLIADELLEIEL